ncbi:heptaprenyl diphosphate synthase component 1 [Kurthia sibirica]|uniref:Heptaprenyl diphosphate synthase n=1 Tax=Kurthia sibirica TaxID=202750 RepID=A0A2U3AIQ7_9BACL|nr:heptaprenyl diphosphate synthase component 1 [Kurthia sibirica]PWI24436.1 heptaprenyl diphosphate synthase [Kurthia sibirica]GEK35178.1 hypothetical protein KSI01_27110 [Kurthia sibirica]
MNAAKTELLVTELKDEIYSKLHHRTLQEYAGQPIIWEDQLFYLLLPNFNGGQWTAHHQVAASCVAMIQTALTTHDLVMEHNATTKAQQLTVLAGDYYSGMYYATLASLPNIQLVQALSTAVADISERKTALYEPNDKTFSKWLEQFEVIVSKAVEQFYHHFNFGSYTPLMKKGMLIGRLFDELKALENNSSTIRFDDITSDEPLSNEQVIAKIHHVIQQEATCYTTQIHASSLLSDELKIVMLSRVEALISEQQLTREG